MNINISAEPLFSSAEIRSLTLTSSLLPSSSSSSSANEVSSSSSCSSTPLTSPTFTTPTNCSNIKDQPNQPCPPLFPCLNAQGMVDDNMLNMFMMTSDIHSVDPQLLSNFIKTDGMGEVCVMMPDGSMCDINTVNPEVSTKLLNPTSVPLQQQQITSHNTSASQQQQPQQQQQQHAIVPPSSSTMSSSAAHCAPPIISSPSVVLVSPKQQIQQRKKNTITSLSGNKRKLEAEPLSPLTADGLLTNGTGFEACPQLSPDEERSLKRQRRLVKNREAAQQFRQRQKNYISDLENKVEELTALNTEYASKIELLNSENKIVREQLARLHDFVSQALPGRQVPFPLMYMPPNSNKQEERTAETTSASMNVMNTHHHHHLPSSLPFGSPLLSMGYAMHPATTTTNNNNANNGNGTAASPMDSPASSPVVNAVPQCLPVDYGYPYGFYPHFTGMASHMNTMPHAHHVAQAHHQHHFHPMMTPSSANMQCSPTTDNMSVASATAACEQAAN